MALARSSVLLRTQLRPAAGLAAPLLRRSQLRPITHGVRRDDDLGGPMGQQPPPLRPGGPEALRRNWMPIAGGVVALLLGIQYMSSFDKPPRTPESDLKASMSTEIGYLPPPRPNAKQFDRNAEVHSLTEMSGRKGGGSMGPFRAE